MHPLRDGLRFAAGLLISAALFAAPPTIQQRVVSMDATSGFLPFYLEPGQGKIWLEIGRWNQELLYISSLPAGIGSNDIGLDRGQLGRTRLVRWERRGPRAFLVQVNSDYRAATQDEEERRAVRDSFAESVLWGFDVAAEEGGRVLVDATAFFLRDVHGVGRTLERAKQGAWKPEASRSALYLPRTKNFPKNTEVEATITFTGGPPGAWLRSVSPDGESFTVRMHHSFVELPGAGYLPRGFDPRSGFGAIQWMDYATPIHEPIVKRYAVRHRLQKKDPAAAVSEAVEPIVYYLDRGTPEPVRTALLEGARWWNAAFEAAGFRNAFQVAMMPEGADPMDVRYNVIQWVHRSTRGWSYGSSVVDPRTGEIIKGHVTLGSLRVRQDYLIAEAFLAPYETGKPRNPAMEQMALARLRQLSAHEVGHTLGLMHNYIASTQDRASVMDYPHPLVELDASGAPTLKNAYSEGIAEWDKVSINWGYREFPSGGNEKSALNRILDEARGRGLIFLTDIDARPEGSSHPQTHLWDNGRDASSELLRMLKVRAAAIARFGENNLREGQPLALLEDVFVPLYFSHRYQTESAVKVIGGLRYAYALRGDGQKPTEFVPPAEQRAALDAVLATLKPDTVAVPERIAALIPPRPAEYDPTRELLRGRTGRTLDPLAAAETAASMTTSLLFHPERASRLVELNSRDAGQPSLSEVIDRTMNSTWKSTRLAGYAGEVQRAADHAVLRSLFGLAVETDASPQARAVATLKLAELESWLGSPANKSAPDAAQRAHYGYALQMMRWFREKPEQFKLPKAPEPPPGMPIGSCDH
jgi:hypothetical protein